MKTLLLSIFFAVGLQALSAQQDFAFVDNRISDDPGLDIMVSAAAEPVVAAQSYTINDIALISLGKGFREAVKIQVLTPGTKILVNQDIPAGQKQVKIDLSGLENGTYTVRINLKDKTWIRQVIKE